MDIKIAKKFEEQEKKLEAIYESVEKIRKYFLLTFWITIAILIFPIIGLTFIIPSFINTYTNLLGGI